MNRVLERLGAIAARRSWIVILAWLVILGGLLGARQAFGGEYIKTTRCPVPARLPALTSSTARSPSKAGRPARSCSTPRTGRSRRSKPP